jgi:NAD+ kinase
VLGLVVHPSRAIEHPLRELRAWADLRGVELVQVLASCAQQSVAHPGDAEACDLLVSIGGDGTALAAMRAGAVAARPVLAVTCGSLGALTSVPASSVVAALERFSTGDWAPRHLPALAIEPELGAVAFALNDIAIVRAGGGQVRLTVQIDGNLVARLAGDGCVVSTPLGSSAYALAAGGPLLPLDMPASLFTPLLAHGGSCPPVVIGPASAIRLDATGGHPARLELDGQVADALVPPITVRLRAAVATVVTFSDQETFLAVLRKRQIIADSPRLLAEDARAQRAGESRSPISLAAAPARM